jgi:hypothetical protein
MVFYPWCWWERCGHYRPHLEDSFSGLFLTMTWPIPVHLGWPRAHFDPTRKGYEMIYSEIDQTRRLPLMNADVSGPLKYCLWFTNIAHKPTPISVGHYDTPSNSPKIAPKYPPILVGHLNTLSDSPILHPNTHPFYWATIMPHLIHQYHSQIHSHFSGPLRSPIWLTNIAPKFPPMLVGHYDTPSDSPILHPNTHPF